MAKYPQGTPNNIMPYIAQVATGERSELTNFGNDYPTVDGTGVRDYIHVVDLARGHVAALAYNKPGMTAVNLGTGHGTSVLQLVHAFEKASGKTIPYKIAADVLATCRNITQKPIGLSGYLTGKPKKASRRLR